MDLDKIQQLIDFVEKKSSEDVRSPSIEYSWIGLNQGPKVVRLYAPALPEFREKPEDPTFIFFSRIKNKEGRLIRVYWPYKKTNLRPVLDKDFILYKALKTIETYDKEHPIFKNNRNEGNKFAARIYPVFRIVFNAFDRIKNKVGILTEKTYISPSNMEISMDVGISERLYDQIIQEVLRYRKTLDLDLFIQRDTVKNTVLYDLRDFYEDKKPELLRKYGREDKPNFEGLYNLDELFPTITEEKVKEEFPHILEVAEKLEAVHGKVQEEEKRDLKTEYSEVSEEDLKILRSLREKAKDLW